MAYNMVQSDELGSNAIALIREAWVGYDESYDAGFMSCAIYDTPWISMIVKKLAGEKLWLFPQ